MVAGSPVESDARPGDVSVSFTSTDGCPRLAGTLAVPGGSRTAAVVLVSGTGPIDRDVTFAGHALFRTLADALAARGIASLRFDKRGVGESGGDFSSATAGDFVADVLGASDYLVAHEGFAPGHVGLLGHSEGGMVALSAAARAPRTAFCVSLAGPLLSGRDNAVHSFALLARGRLERDSAYERYVMEMDTLLTIARSRAPPGREREANELAARVAPLIFSTVEECDRLLGMINTMLMISKAESGMVELSHDEIDLTAVAREACNLFQTMAEDKGVELVCDLAQEVRLSGDIRMIQRMLAVRLLPKYAIAREVGVSANFVSEVAQGKRVAVDTARPPLSAGERFLGVPIRCSVCRAMISVVPCRACRTKWT